MTESLSLRSELQELQICQLKTTGNFEAELIIWTTNTRNYRDIMQSVCVSFWNYTKSTERGQSTQRKLKQVNWKHHYSSSGVKEEQTHLAVPWDAQNHPFLLIIQLWIIASQTFPYCSAAHCFLQLSLSPATTLPPFPVSLKQSTANSATAVLWMTQHQRMENTLTASCCLIFHSSSTARHCFIHFCLSVVHQVWRKKKKKPPASSCNSCSSWRTDLQRAQLPPSQEAHTPLRLLYSDRARLPRALLTYLCAGWVIPTATNKSYYLSYTNLDSTEWLMH